MKAVEEKYLERSLMKLADYLPFDRKKYLDQCHVNKDLYRVEIGENGHVYCLFSYHDPVEIEWLILLVYEGENIIADCSCACISGAACRESETVYASLAEESDWLYLERQLVDEEMTDDDLRFHEVLLYSSIYVTKRYRRRGIFQRMMEMSRDFVIDRAENEVFLYSVMSLDPDIACYGEDTPKEPYIYNFEKDEPDRIRNRIIAAKAGYVPLCIESMKEAEGFDGTKCWFAIKKEHIVLLEGEL